MPFARGKETQEESFALFETPGAEALLETHKDLVLKLAKHHARCRGMSVEDLAFEGKLGLLKAAQKFNPSRGVKFSTYAAFWVRQAMLRALDNKSRTVRLPWQSSAKLKRLREAKAAFLREHGREGADSEIAQASGLSLRMMRGLQGSCLETFSIDAPTASGQSGKERSLMDSIPDNGKGPYETLAEKDSQELFRKALSTLDSREAKIIKLRFGLERGRGEAETCESVGAKTGLSREGVRKIQERSISKLRAILLPELMAARQDAIAV